MRCLKFLILLLLGLASAAFAQPVEILPLDFRGAVQPQIAVSASGNVFVAFGKDSSIYCTASTDGAKTFHVPIKIATLPKLALGMRRGPRIAATDNSVAVSAISHETGELYVWVSSDVGNTWSDAVTINSVTNSAREGLDALAGDGRGNLCIAWLDCRSSNNQLWSATSHDGGKTWGANVQVYQSPEGHVCPCCHPSVAYLSDGKIRAMWRNWLSGSRDMYVTDSADGGKTFGPPRKCGDGSWQFNACPMDGGSVAEQFTTWMRSGAVYYTDADLTEHLLDSDGHQPVVALGKAGVYFLWQNGTRLMLKSGPTASPTVLAEDAVYPSIATASTDSHPIVVWESRAEKTIFAEVLP